MTGVTLVVVALVVAIAIVDPAAALAISVFCLAFVAIAWLADWAIGRNP